MPSIEQELLTELRHAHLIIGNALRIMTLDQRTEWAQLNDRDGCIGGGTTRANERETLIRKATGGQS